MASAPIVATRCQDCGVSEQLQAHKLRWRREQSGIYSSLHSCADCGRVSTLHCMSYIANWKPTSNLTPAEHRALVDAEMKAMGSRSLLDRYGGNW